MSSDDDWLNTGDEELDEINRRIDQGFQDITAMIRRVEDQGQRQRKIQRRLRQKRLRQRRRQHQRKRELLRALRSSPSPDCFAPSSPVPSPRGVTLSFAIASLTRPIASSPVIARTSLGSSDIKPAASQICLPTGWHSLVLRAPLLRRLMFGRLRMWVRPPVRRFRRLGVG